MKTQIKWLFLGFGLAGLLFVGAGGAFVGVLIYQGKCGEPVLREQALPSGKKIQIRMCNLLWGVDHDDRHKNDDQFGLEYISNASHDDLAALDKETLEAFELIRPISEQWGIDKAQVAAFPTTRRKGRYYLYIFTRQPQGARGFERRQEKVFIND
jgi:hypothetical protein